MSQDQNLGNGANAWGQSPADFQVDPGIRAQVSAAAARAQKPAHKGKRVGRRPKPKPPKPRLAPEVDEYHRFSDTLVAELETEERYEELEHGSEEGDAETNEMRHSDVSDALVNTMIEMMVEVCGPVPSCEMFPEDVQHSIRKHDGDCMAILGELLEEAISTPEDRVQE